jgi:hypothetical protein
MKTFLAIYLGSPTSGAKADWDRLDPQEREKRQAAGMKAWKDWGAAHRADIVDGGGPLGKTKRTDARGVTDVRNTMVGYVILNAESHEAAAKLFEKHPHFTLFPGEAVEIMECLPIPGQR